MKIPVVGMDPSLTNWGIAKGLLDLEDGCLEVLDLQVIETEVGKNKQVRVNSTDLGRAELLAKSAMEAAQWSKVVFAEVPVGSQSANAMKAYGVCVGILGAIRASGVQIIEVTALEVKLHLSGKKHATKEQMIKAAVALYPNANFPKQGERVTNKAEHVADALGAIHAGVHTPVFQNLMRLYAR